MNLEPMYEKHKAIKSVLRKFHLLQNRSSQKFNTDNLCVIFDISTALENIKITDKQQRAINLFISGYTYEEIGVAMEISKQTAEEHVTKVCKKISRYLCCLDKKDIV